jgi:hypothetical protein
MPSLGAAVIGIGKDDAQRHQAERARQHMQPERGQRRIARQAAAHGERKRQPDGEEEEREDHIHIGHRVYVAFGVMRPPRQTADVVEIVDEDHDGHGQAAEDVDRGEARRGGVHRGFALTEGRRRKLILRHRTRQKQIPPG